MADITMCVQARCPNWGGCYRAQATPGPMQSWAAFDYFVAIVEVVCAGYIPMSQEESMPTKNEIAGMMAQIKAARAQLESAEDALSDAREVLRDAAALMDAMAVELAERAEA